MKLRFFVAICLVVTVALAVTLLTLPLIELTYDTRSGGLPEPGSGAFLDYVFDTDAANYSTSVPLGERYSQYSGFVELSDEGSALELHEQLSPLGGHTLFLTHTLEFSVPFAQAFVNQWALSDGGVESVDGQLSSVSTDSTPYSCIFGGALPPNVTEDSAFLGETDPWQLSPIHPNETGTDSLYVNSLPPLQFDYDSAGNSYILVDAVFSGNASFVTDLLPSQGITSVTGLVVNLIGSNIDVGPVDLTHYLTQNLLPAIVVAAAGTVLTVLVIRRSRLRIRSSRITLGGPPHPKKRQ